MNTMRRQQFRQAQTAIRSPSALSDAATTFHSYDALINPSRPVRSSPLANSTIIGLPLDHLDRLKAFPLFRSVPESFLHNIGKSLKPKIYQANQEIIREGEEARAIYWLVRGSVRVVSLDGESTYAELKPGSFFGEIGIFMNIPRTATITATTRSLVVRLSKEDLQKELPTYPQVERAIRDEALERLAILERKKKETNHTEEVAGLRRKDSWQHLAILRKRSRDHSATDEDTQRSEAGSLSNGEVLTFKKRKSPSPRITESTATNTLGDALIPIRQLLKSLPLFCSLPDHVLHFLGINAIPASFEPFKEIIAEGSSGRDVYFITRGEVEVFAKCAGGSQQSPSHHLQVESTTNGRIDDGVHIKARLRAGQYFGEVTSLSLAPTRTATVRSVTSVECLVISAGTLDGLWEKCEPELRQRVEIEAMRRLKLAKCDDAPDVEMTGIPRSPPSTTDDGVTQNAKLVAASNGMMSSPPAIIEPDDSLAPFPQSEPIDPDPFFSTEFSSMRSKSRRSSLAPPSSSGEGPGSPLLDTQQRTPSPPTTRLLKSSPIKSKHSPSTSPFLGPQPYRPRSHDAESSQGSTAENRGPLPEAILVRVFHHADLADLMRYRSVSSSWCRLLNESRDVLHHLDLSPYNRLVTDAVIQNIITPFAGTRPRSVDMSNCFHITDQGFQHLVEHCGENVRVWKMKSVWEVSAPAILALTSKAKDLEEIDFSNCRKVGDNLLARVIGWVVTEQPSQTTPLSIVTQAGKRPGLRRGYASHASQQEPVTEAPGTVVGAAKLKRLTLSYCKHVQDRSMAHIAMHASGHLEMLDLTRCTSVTDAGLHSWGNHEFKNLRKLVLADCTYLSDQAIIGVVKSCRGLLEIDLSFCCALSDTSTEVLAMGLPFLRSLDMAFCGSAISDNSLRRIATHLLELRYLSVRGCVRVTGQGVEQIVEGCRHLRRFDVSQCKNLQHWLADGGVARVNRAVGEGRMIEFQTVADGSWRVGPH